MENPAQSIFASAAWQSVRWVVSRFNLVTSIVILVLKRVLNNVRMLLSTFVGLVIAVSVISSLPLFTGGTIEKLLRDSLSNHPGRPIGTVWIRYIEGMDGKSNLEQYWSVDEYFRENLAWLVDVPVKQVVRYFATDTYVFWPADEFRFVPFVERKYGYLVFQSDLAEHINIIDGEPLPKGPADPADEIPATVHISAADKMHLTVGDRIIYTDVQEFNPKGVFLRIVGIWQEKDPAEHYWIYDPYQLDNVLFITEEAMHNVVLKRMPKVYHEYSWYAQIDEDYINSANVGRVRSGLLHLESRIKQELAGARLSRELPDLLNTFELQAIVINLLLLILSLPTMAVVLYYIATSFGMVLERQRNEIALLKSRGASTFQVMGIYSLEGLVMGGFAFVGGPLVGLGIAQVIGQTYGFLAFAQRPALSLQLTSQVWEYAAGTVAVSMLASLGPAIGAARYNIVTFKQESARSLSLPLWQRFFVDFFLLAVAAYGYRMLSQQQRFAIIGESSELLIDPLLMIVPAVFIIATALLFLRLFPLITAGLAQLASLFASPWLLMALRQISRTPVQYSALVLLLVLTIGLGAYSASAAHTIDRNFREQVYYRIPADLAITETWMYNEETSTWYEPPFSDHFVPGVQEAMPVRINKVKVPWGRAGDREGSLIAIDRIDFPKISWWRSDFARVPLGALMNTLGVDQAAAIVNPAVLAQNGLHIGDRLVVRLSDYPVEFIITETTDYFPAVYPDKGPILIVNYDYVRDIVGPQPYDVWIKLAPNVLSKDVIDAISDRKINIFRINDSRVEVTKGRTQPQRTGLFGVLSIGFIVAAVLTMLGFFLYSFLSFERRLLQMGILRAMGLSVRQLFGLLVFEQVFLIVIGVLVGTALGVATGYLFIPFFQLGNEKQIPPFVVTTAWSEILRLYVVLGVMLLLGLASTIWLISRMQLFRAVKLGEEQ